MSGLVDEDFTIVVIFDGELTINHADSFLMRISRALIQLQASFATRVGGNPESKQRFQTHVMSDLVNDELNNAVDS